MIAVDTNVVVRLLTRDDETQYQKSLVLFEEYDVFIPDTILLEIEWVLRYAYDFEADAICEVLSRLFGLPNVHLSNPVLLAQAIKWNSQGMDFADALHLSQCQQCNQFFTFDNKFIHQAKGVCPCPVLKPPSPNPFPEGEGVNPVEDPKI